MIPQSLTQGKFTCAGTIGEGGGAKRNAERAGTYGVQRSARICAAVLATGGYADATLPCVDGIVPDADTDKHNCPALAAMLKLVSIEPKYAAVNKPSEYDKV